VAEFKNSILNGISHIEKKRKQIDLKMKDMYWLIGRNSRLSLENNILGSTQPHEYN
jgi:hypothetical protein